MARKRQGQRFATKGNLKAGELGQHQTMYSGREYGDRGEMKAKPRTGFVEKDLTAKERAAKSGPSKKWSRGEVARENAKRRAAAKAAAAAKSDASKTPGEKKKPRTGSRAGGAAFNPKLLGRSSPTDFIRGGRGPSGIPKKNL